jgi:pimeloyl-ACP methyl ester carboxylesterase
MKSFAVCAMLVISSVAAYASPRAELPVRSVMEHRLHVSAGAASGDAVYGGENLDVAHPDAVRALIFVHGEQRDADVYERIAQKAIALGATGRATLLIVPQFLETQDVADGRDRDLLRWSKGRWIDGLPADAPAPISSFSVLDAILDRLADRTAFPALKTVVIAGHSAGAQLIQRYAVVGREDRILRERGIAVRYVVANPSSYVYFNADRPTGQGAFAPFDASSCPSFNHWKYGVDDAPPYVTGETVSHLEDVYAARDVVYLIGTADNDPHQAALDRTCPAEAQGPQRYARAHAYFSYLQQRHPAFTQRIFDVPGAGHSATAMFTSATALPILFE